MPPQVFAPLLPEHLRCLLLVAVVAIVVGLLLAAVLPPPAAVVVALLLAAVSPPPVAAVALLLVVVSVPLVAALTTLVFAAAVAPVVAFAAQFAAGAELGVVDGVAPDCPRRVSNFRAVLFFVRVTGAVGDPLDLLGGDVALVDCLLLVAVRLFVALFEFGDPVMAAAVAPVVLAGDVLV